MELAERELRDLVHPAEPKRVADRGDSACRWHATINVTPATISFSQTAHRRRGAGPRQGRDVYPRQDYDVEVECRKIGRRFGGRDHTTVLHAVKKMEALVETVPILAEAHRGDSGRNWARGSSNEGDRDHWRPGNSRRWTQLPARQAMALRPQRFPEHNFWWALRRFGSIASPTTFGVIMAELGPPHITG